MKARFEIREIYISDETKMELPLCITDTKDKAKRIIKCLNKEVENNNKFFYVIEEL